MSILLKKVTAAVSAIAIISSALGTSVVSAAEDGKVAFAKALANNSPKIIDISDDYRTSANITRAEAAGTALKLKLNGVLPADYACKGTVFSDITVKSEAWHCRAAELAVDNGLASTSNTKFRAADDITRAEALAMILKATGTAIPATTTSEFQDNFAATWQRDVANAALAAGIASANPTFNPNNTITRGEFMVFAYRAGKAAGTITTDVADYEEDLGLGEIIGGGDTGTTGTGGTVVAPTAAGNLTVGLNPTSPATGTQVPMVGIVRFAVVDLTAGGSDISLNSVELAKAGLASIPSWTKVWFEKNGVRVSGKASFTSENTAVISFAPALTIKAAATESLDLYVDLSTTAGNDFQFTSKAISSSAKTVTGSFTTAVLRTASYTVASATITPTTSAQSNNASTDAIEIGKFTIANTDTNSDTRDIKFQSVSLYQSGTANLTNLSNITVERNGVVVSSAASVAGKVLSLTVWDTIKDGASAIYIIKAVINNVELTTDTYQLYLKNTSDINLIETATAYRATIGSTAPITGAIYSVTGGDVKFERDASVTLSKTVAPGTSDVVLMQGSITAKSAVNLENVTVAYTTTSLGNTSMNTVYLQIGNSTFTATPADTNATSGTLSFLGTATVNGTAPVKMYVKLKDGATGTIKVASLDLSKFTTKEYVVNQNTVGSAIGSISGVTVTVGATTLNLTRTDGLGATSIPSGAKGVTVYGAKFSSTQGNAIALSNLSVTTAGTANSYTAGNTSLTLYVDGVAKSTKSLNTATVNFDNFNTTIDSTKSVEVVVKADFSDVTTSGTFNVASVSYDAVDNITSVAVTKPSVAGATFTIATAVGTVAAATGNDLVNRSLLLAGATNQKLVSFQVTATNDTIKLKKIVLSGTNLDAVSNIRLVDSSMNLLSSASSVTATAGEFVNIDTASGSSITDRNSSTYYVIADVNSNTDVANVSANVVIAGSTITSSNGSVIAIAGVGINGAAHDVAQNTFKITQVTPASKSVATSALQFKVDAYGLNNVTLSGATITTSLWAYATAGFAAARVSIYTTDNQLVGQTAVGTVTGPITLSNFNVVNKGTSATYVVKVEGLTLNASTNEAWTVNLTSLTTSTGLDAVNYPKSTETLPLTSVK